MGTRKGMVLEAGRKKGGNGEASKLLGTGADQVDAGYKVWNPQVGRMVIPIETVIALRKKNLSMPQIAKILGCSKANIRYRLGTVADEIDKVEDWKKHKADILAIHQRRLLNALTPGDLEKAGIKDKSIAFGILFDKERLERGKSTSNIAYADILSIKNQKLKELEKLDEEYGAAKIK